MTNAPNTTFAVNARFDAESGAHDCFSGIPAQRLPVQFVGPDSMDALVNAPWHGNIRELEHFIERCVILSDGGQLKVPPEDLDTTHSPGQAPASTLKDAERNVIVHALRFSSGRISGNGAAERLGVKRTTLQNKMNRLGIQRTEFAL